MTESRNQDGDEKRLLTVLFADLVGSTRLMESLGVDVYLELQQQFHNACTLATRNHGGVVAQYRGDGAICYFGFPVGSEDDAVRAVETGLDILRELEHIGVVAGHEKLATRIGIASGDVIISEGNEGDLNGRAVGFCLNRAARLEASAAPNTILIAEETKRLVGRMFEIEELRDQQLAGFDRAETIYRATYRRGGMTSRFQALRDARTTPLIGRDSELARLNDALKDAIVGKGSVVSLSGEAGIGKSKLLHSFLQQEHVHECRHIMLQCSPEYSLTELHPIRDYLEWVTSIAPQDSDQLRHKRFNRLFTTAWGASGDDLRFLLDVFSPLGSGEPPDEEDSPLRRRRIIFDTLQDKLFGSASGTKALIFVIEDSHWIDPTTYAFIQHFAESLKYHQVLVVCTARPDSQFDVEAGELGSVIRLERLSDSECMLLAGQTALNRLSNDLLGKILPRADGNPLFVEEFVDMLLASSGEQSAPSLDVIPVTIEGMIQSKIDRLEPSARRFAEAGSVIDNRFDVVLAAHAAGLSDEEVEPAVAALESARLIESAESERRFGIRRFEHALIRDAIQASLTGSRRQRLHGKLADASLASSDESVRTSESLARHLAAAGRPGESADCYFGCAAASAGAGNAAEALSKIDKGLEQVSKLEEGQERDVIELRLRAVQAPMRMVTRGPGSPEFGESQAKALALLRRLEIAEQMVPVLFNTALHEWASGRLDEASKHAAELAEAAKASPGDGGYLAVNTMEGLIAWHRGDNRKAKACLSNTIERYEAEKHRDLYQVFLMEFGVFARFYLGLTETVMGNLEEGELLAKNALELGREVHRPHPTGFGLLANFLTSMMREDVEAAERFSAESIEFNGEQQFPEFVAMSRVCRGWTQARSGQGRLGCTLMESGATQWAATGFQSWQALFASMLAEQRVLAGDTETAAAAIDDIQEQINRQGEHQFDVPLAIARIRIAQAQGDTELAGKIREEALSMAEKQGAGLWKQKLLDT